MSELILVTLPIGNKDDITLRALRALENGKIFYAEDTRVFKELLGMLGISYQDKVIDSFHDQSVGKIESILTRLKNGEQVYLVSDAGSPIVSDPAYPLLKKVVEENIQIKTLPGVTAVIAALELSALPPNPFHFWGFVARGKSEKKETFKKASVLGGTHIFYESPHRIFDTIHSFFEVCEQETLVVVREISKSYESVYRIKQSDLLNIESIIVDKGEFVILFNSNQLQSSERDHGEIGELVKDYLEKGGSTKKLAKIFSKILGAEVKETYDQLAKSGK